MQVTPAISVVDITFLTLEFDGEHVVQFINHLN